MQIPITILGAIETAINTWLKLDESTLPRFSELDGKIIRFHITGLDLNLYFLPTPAGIQVLGNYPSEEDGGVVDATIHGSPMSLIKLSTSSNSGEALLKSDVEIEGDTHVAKTFSAILREVDIDWEEHLSRLVGDVVAHQAAQASQSVSNWLKEGFDTIKNNTAEYLRDDAKLTPEDEEVSAFMNQIDDIRMNVDRLEARINLLKNK